MSYTGGLLRESEDREDQMKTKTLQKVSLIYQDFLSLSSHLLLCLLLLLQYSFIAFTMDTIIYEYLAILVSVIYFIIKIDAGAGEVVTATKEKYY